MNTYAFTSDLARALGLAFIVWGGARGSVVVWSLGIAVLCYGLGLARSVTETYNRANRIHH